jgi:hypothetical protein
MVKALFKIFKTLKRRRTLLKIYISAQTMGSIVARCRPDIDQQTSLNTKANSFIFDQDLSRAPDAHYDDLLCLASNAACERKFKVSFIDRTQETRQLSNTRKEDPFVETSSPISQQEMTAVENSAASFPLISNTLHSCRSFAQDNLNNTPSPDSMRIPRTPDRRYAMGSSSNRLQERSMRCLKPLPWPIPNTPKALFDSTAHCTQ